jgi:DNA-binding CsgD family transcriptional regulator/tetratricopeptide (TPR) repeat protein
VDGPLGIGLDSSQDTRVAAKAARLALVERDEAWKLASQAIGRARGGVGSIVLFEGASGLGKTGLLSAIRALAESSGLPVLRAAGRHRETDFPFGVVLQLFGPGIQRRTPLDAADANSRFAAIQEIHGLCLSLAHESPLVVAIDDADLMDEESVRFLLYLTERVSDLPICVFLTAGCVPPRRAPALLAEIARHPSTTSIRLEPLTAQGTARRLAKTSLSAAAQEAAEEIHRTSGGNPFIVDALATAFGDAETGNGGEPTVARARGLASPGIAEWTTVRAADLDPRAAALLHAVAVLGPDCELRHACTLAGVDLGGADEIIDALIDVGIFAPGERLSFAQPAVATAVEESLTHSQRAVANQRAARILADEGEGAERVARHLLLAARVNSRETVETLSVAAAVALSHANPFDAVSFLRRALEEPPPRDMRADVVLELGRAEAMAGEPQAAAHLRDGIAQLGDRPDRPEQALASGRALFALGRPRDALAAFQYGLARAEQLDTDTVASLRAAHTTATWLTCEALPDVLESTVPPATADRPADRALLALHAIGGAVRGLPAAEVRALAERALAHGALLDDETSDGLTYYLASWALAAAGDLQMAEAALTVAVEDSRSRGSVLGFATASQARAMTILRRGRLLDAASDARHALAVERHGWRRGSGAARAVLAHTLMERGDLDAAERHLDRAEAAKEGDPFQFSLLHARGRLTLFRGDADSALELFLESGKIADRRSIVNPAVMAWRADAGLATAVVGDWREAERLIESELSLARDFGEPAAIGRALVALGAIREPDRAIEALEAAVAELENSHAALVRATALVEYGAALRRSGRRRDAREPLKSGLELAEGCGATVLAAKALREAKVAGARPRRSALHGRESLTTRERQVAMLAAEGLSNREIANKLVVTKKTVEWHLNHSFGKLGIRSRTELPANLGDVDADPAPSGSGED